MSNAPRATRLLSEHRKALETMLRNNAAAHVTRIARLSLNALDDRARTWLARIEREARSPSEGFTGSTLGMFGENGAAPGLRDICRQAQMTRERGRIERAA